MSDLTNVALLAPVLALLGAYVKQRSDISRWRGEVDSRLSAIEAENRVVHERIDRKESARDAEFKQHDAKLDRLGSNLSEVKTSLAALISRLDERDRHASQRQPH